MKTRCLIFILLASQQLVVAQNAINKELRNPNYIQKFNGDVQYSKKIEIRKKAFKNPYFELDSTTIACSEVKTFQSDDGFFINLKNSYPGQRSDTEFAQRSIEGKINAFTHTSIRTAYMPSNGVDGMPNFVPTQSKSVYYTKGTSRLKTATLYHLKRDLSDHSIAFNYLSKYENAKEKRMITYIVSGLAAVIGILSASEKTGESSESFNMETGRFETVEKTTLKPYNLAIGLGGFVTFVVTSIRGSKEKGKFAEEAILLYNE
jgi:hypothetical protein